jgi:hypothetical protein
VLFCWSKACTVISPDEKINPTETLPFIVFFYVPLFLAEIGFHGNIIKKKQPDKTEQQYPM